MDFQATLDAHGITWERNFVDAAILMGTDFNAGIDGIGPKTAVKLVTEHGDLWGALEARDAHVDHAERIRDMFLTPAVTDDYDLDLTMDPDVEAAREFVTGEWKSPRTKWNVGSNVSRTRWSRPGWTSGPGVAERQHWSLDESHQHATTCDCVSPVTWPVSPSHGRLRRRVYPLPSHRNVM